MIAPLNEIIGLPLATPATELACAAERCCQVLFDRASGGDASAQREIVELRVASLIWAYANREARYASEFH
ncbi:MAG: hypothetical protein ABIK82_19895 [Pseudomonadota bacterium]